MADENESNALNKLIETYREKAENANWPEFDAYWKHVMDWRKYVTPEVRAAWGFLPLAARCAVVSICEVQASEEVWD